MMAKAEAAVAAVKVPNLQASSSAQLAKVSSLALSNLSALAGPDQPAVAQQVAAVQASMQSNRTYGGAGTAERTGGSGEGDSGRG
ncbi:MAG: hypothetical protein J6386_03030 [Candidatus Synoicihabitans palmerolidicus]|nr:hypothetical protein [Candidatus Synoicihabitans palmerolidicus]